MPNPNAIVARIAGFDPTLDRPAVELLRSDTGLSVVLDGDRRVRLDSGDPRSVGFTQILEGLRKQGLPVYIEVDPNTSAIERLLIPHVTRVQGIRRIDIDALGIELERSHGRHVLRTSSGDFAELEKQLREALSSGAPVILTENDAHEIIDVREYRPGPEDPPRPFPRPELLPELSWLWRWLRDFWRWPWWPWQWCWWPWWSWWWCRCVTATRAQEIFDAMSATTCDPLTVPAPCIPFLYPDDGCWGRAHEMCRLMIAMGEKPKKVWIRGALYVSTRNSPNCGVWWGWHVAPIICVRGPGFFQTQYMVIDPSLFSTPVPIATWKGVQGDPNATLTDSHASIFYLWGGITDPTYTQTNQVLATYRLQLQNRALQVGPPPYAQCP